MSTLTISAPIAARRAARASTVASLPCGQRSARARSHPGPWATSPTAPARAGREAPLRLTRRGRVVIFLLLLAIGVVVSLVATSSGAASDTAGRVPVQYVTVAPGDSLWSIAGDVAPDADRRDTVAEIMELNALSGSSVNVGQRIAVPLSR